MKFKLVQTIQTANGWAFIDRGGNTWQAWQVHNVTTGRRAFLPATVEVCNSLRGAARYQGRPVMDQVTYDKWAAAYSLEHTPETTTPLIRKLAKYVKKQSATLYRRSYPALQAKNSTKTSYV